MQLHDLQPIHKAKKKKRIGRGGKRGTYAGRGQKGQKSRAGAKFNPIIRQVVKRYPKLRGYRFNPRDTGIAIINLDILEKKFKENDTVNPNTLIEKKIIRKIKGKAPQVKILAKGNIKKPLTVQGCDLSKIAKEKIEKAKGNVVS
jgi:large subunit ribosomal protein L15